MSGFSNPIIGGGGALVYPAIQSPNFVKGSAGWRIAKDGSAEFNNAVIRNGQVISGTSLYYSGAPALGNLIASIAAAGGTDTYGNVYQQGITSYGSGFFTRLNNGQLAFLYAGFNQPSTVTSGGNDLYLYSGQSLAGDKVAYLTLAGSTAKSQIFASPAGPGPFGSTAAFFEIDGGLALVEATAGTQAAGMRVSGDTSDRLAINADGSMHWGPGNAAADTDLFRGGASLLQTDDAVALANLAAPAPISAAAIIHALAGQLKYVAATGDGNDYNTGRLTKLTAGQTISSASLAAISGWNNIPVAAGTYYIRLTLEIDYGGTGAAALVAVSQGSAAFTNALLHGWLMTIANSNQSVIATQKLTTKSTWTTPALTANTNYLLHLEGEITFTAAGTFGLSAAEGTAGDTWAIPANCSLHLEPVS